MTRQSSEDRLEFSQRFLPLESALQRIEQRLDSIALESNLQRLELSTASNQQESTESLLAKLEEHLGMSKHRFSMQSILTKVEMHLDTMHDMPVVEPLMRKLEFVLQTHQQSATDSLMAKIERKLDMSHSMRQVQSEFACLIGKYEQRLNAEMNRGVGAIQTLSAILGRPGLLRQGHDIRPAPSWTQPQTMPSSAVPSADIQSMTEESEQVPGLSTSARGATGGTLE